MERDILLVAAGALIGLASSMITLVAVYVLEGMRLRRRWEREDQVLLRQKRDELQQLMTSAEGPESRPGGERRE
jgi:hypothetical protein